MTGSRADKPFPESHQQLSVHLRQAITLGNIPMIKLLFKLGHDINGMNSGRKTALYYTAKKRMLSIMELLLDLGADPNILHAGRKNSFRLVTLYCGSTEQDTD
ncbi:hypothetical protein McanMca71_002104 [Microsporum canis]